MTPEQFKVLVTTIIEAAHNMTLVAGIGITVLTVVLAGAVAAVFRAWGKRIDSAIDEAGRAKGAAVDLAGTVAGAATTCRELRAECREDLLDRFVPRKGVVAMDDNVKNTLGQQLESLKEMIADNKKTVVDKFDELTGHLEKFEDEMWNALHGHRHAEDDGAVIRGGNPKRT